MDRVLEETIHEETHDLALDLLLSSDDELEPRKGSRPGRSANNERGRDTAAVQLYNDYFSLSPTYNSRQFARRFRLSLPVVQRIIEELPHHDRYFVQREDCTKKKGFNCMQKVTAALRLLAYGTAADSVDEYIRMAEPTASECLKRFAKGIIACFGDEYLREPTLSDMQKILRRSARRGFPGMLGSMDCCKWKWKNCPTAHHGQYQGKEGEAAMTLEAIADDRLWIWHMFFGMAGCNNDVNVLDASPLKNKIANGTYPPPVEYIIAGKKRSIPYWLADGIYPRWPVFVQTVLCPATKKEKLMATHQEGARKDVERAFGVLQGKWHILARPSRLWYKDPMKSIMKCCVILHNMMVEYREESDEPDEDEDGCGDVRVGEGATPVWATYMERESAVPPPGSIGAICGVERFMRNEGEYFVTRELVMEHLWRMQQSI